MATPNPHYKPDQQLPNRHKNSCLRVKSVPLVAVNPEEIFIIIDNPGSLGASVNYGIQPSNK